jgi:hypothetical protein
MDLEAIGLLRSRSRAAAVVMVSATTPFVLATTARPRVPSLMVRLALDNVHIAATIALTLTVALLSRLVARPLKAFFVPSARWWWCTVSGRVLPVISM